LALLAGLNGASMLVAVSADLIMFVAGLISSFAGSHGRRWAWYTISCIAYLTVVYQIGYHGGQAARAKDSQIRKFFGTIGPYFLILLVGYPIIWAASTHSRRMSVDAEIITLGVLDLLSQAVFAIWLLFTHDRMQSKTMVIDGFWVVGVNAEGTIRIGEGESA
jgi:bacteriorhodopsin